MNDITYIFGAGASCHSMPMVYNFPLRYQLFKEHVTLTMSLNRQFSTDISEFGNQVESHSSFDTFFKKLFHQNQSDAIINRYKRILLLYLLFEHLIPISEIAERQTHKNLEKEGLQKKFDVDPRYESLIAGLLKPVRGKAIFRTKINFFTWNYDLNLLYSLKNFIAPEESLEHFIITRKNENLIVVNEQVKVYHLNGHILHSAMNAYNTSDAYNAFYSILNSNVDLEEYPNSIQFSWEHGSIDHKLIHEAINDSNTVVICGYSIPLYNREVDSILLNKNYLMNKKLFIQDLNAGSIIDLLASDFNIKKSSKGDPDIIPIENCKSFFVPNSIFAS